jgi:UDP-2,4-diacetamido-2,4,6-trideoxy-beta-L-altropyranose hydrolase
MRVVFRVDASTDIGLGHIKRCLALAHALARRGASAAFICRDLSLDSWAMVSAEGFACRELPAPTARAEIGSTPIHAAWACVDTATDARDTLQALGNDAVDWVVIDHYAFDAEWHRAVSVARRCRIAAIDDLADRDLAAEVVIDQNHSESHAAKYAGRIGPRTRILGGPLYALLGPMYAHAPRYEFHDTVRSIGIFMGGVDSANLSILALQAVRERLGFAGGLEIVTTSSNPSLAQLRDMAAVQSATALTVNLPDLSGFFAKHDLHIGAGGGATWERCCIGAPTLAMVVAENQRQVLLPLQRLGVLRTLTELPANVEGVARETQALLNNGGLRFRMATRARQLVDGQGADRVATHLIEACTR